MGDSGLVPHSKVKKPFGVLDLWMLQFSTYTICQTEISSNAGMGNLQWLLNIDSKIPHLCEWEIHENCNTSFNILLTLHPTPHVSVSLYIKQEKNDNFEHILK